MTRPLRSAACLPALLGVVCLLMASPGPAGAQSTRAATASERFAHRHRALAPTERALALEIAREPAHGELRRRAGRAPGALERIEILAVELHRHAKGTRAADYRRRADVYIYDYGSDQLAWAVVDLDGNRVESVTVTPSVQRPLSEREVAHALDLVFADAASLARIRAEFARIAGRPLRDRRDLEVAGFVYRADAMPDSNTADSAACGRHRCAQLLIRTRDEVSLELPIVDLSRERVLEPRWFGPPPAAPAPDAADRSTAPKRKQAEKPGRAGALPATATPTTAAPAPSAGKSGEPPAAAR